MGAALVVSACAVATSSLPEADYPPKPDPGAARPSLSYSVSFLPPDARAVERLTAEFVGELSASGQFGELRAAPAPADLTVRIELSQIPAATGKTLIWYLVTGGLLPVRFPYHYAVEAHALRLPGREREYTVTDRASVTIWEPGSLGQIAGDVLAMDPTSSRIRRNLYRTLIRRMYDEGMLEPPPTSQLVPDGLPLAARAARSAREPRGPAHRVSCP